MGYGVCVRIRGDMALFTRPEAKGERMSYSIITPSAARGILESVFWHPGMRYVVDQITVLNPIRFDSVRRNEVGAVAKLGSIKAAYTSGAPLFLDSNANRQQRASVILRDVDYLVEAHFEMPPGPLSQDDEKKYYNMLLRRLRRGQHHAKPCLGCREFPADVSLVEGDKPESFYRDAGEQDLGYMLHDIDYDKDCTPVFFHAVMRGGVVTPSVVTPSVATPSVVTPSVATPSVATPSVATPSVVTPEGRP